MTEPDPAELVLRAAALSIGVYQFLYLMPHSQLLAVLHAVQLLILLLPSFPIDPVSHHFKNNYYSFLAYHTAFNCLSPPCRACDYVYIDYVRRSRSSSCRLLRPINCQTYITLHYCFRLEISCVIITESCCCELPWSPSV